MNMGGLKVAANHMEVVVVGSLDIDISDRELVSHVRRVLRSVSSTKGNSDDNYQKLIDTVKKTHHLTVDEVAFLVTTLKALTGAVSCIDVDLHTTLLSDIRHMNMWWYREDVMYALADLIVTLAASNGALVHSCLEMLVGQFIPPEGYLRSKEKKVLDCVHSTLKNITDLVPLAPMVLLELIPREMPKIYADEASLNIYVKNMLRLESSPIGEPLREGILKALVDRRFGSDDRMS